MTPKSYIENLIKERITWIEKKLSNCLQKKDDLIITDGSFISFLGEKHLVKLTHWDKKKIEITYLHEIFYISIPPNTPNDKILKKIDAFYKDKIIKIMTPLLDYYTNKMQLYPKKVTYKKVKSKWGSCSYADELVFSTLLAKKSVEFIKYVIIHELAHMIHKHHKSDFHELVEIYMPNYKEIIKRDGGFI